MATFRASQHACSTPSPQGLLYSGFRGRWSNYLALISLPQIRQLSYKFLGPKAFDGILLGHAAPYPQVDALLPIGTHVSLVLHWKDGLKKKSAVRWIRRVSRFHECVLVLWKTVLPFDDVLRVGPGMVLSLLIREQTVGCVKVEAGGGQRSIWDGSEWDEGGAERNNDKFQQGIVAKPWCQYVCYCWSFLAVNGLLPATARDSIPLTGLIAIEGGRAATGAGHLIWWPWALSVQSLDFCE